MLEARYAAELDVLLLAELNQEMIAASGHSSILNREELIVRMKNWITSGEYEAILFFCSNELVGYCLFRGRSTICLRQFLIRKRYRGRGVGQSAFEFLKENVWSKDSTVKLDVYPTNSSGYAFWRRLGFNGEPESMVLNIGLDSSKPANVT